jgi:hypothetical protein
MSLNLSTKAFYLFLASLSLMTGGLEKAWAQKSASVLPKGIYRVRMVGIMPQAITQTLNSQGQAESLVSALEQRLGTYELAQINQELMPLYEGLNAYEAGLGDSLVNIDLIPRAEIHARQAFFAAEYGINEKLSVGIIVPMVTMDVKAGFRAEVNNQAEVVAARVQGMGDLEVGMNAFSSGAPTAQTFENGIFLDKGYDLPRDFNYSGLGDVEVGLKYLFSKSDWHRSSFTGGFRAPTTSHNPNPRNILDRRTGDKQWDLAAELTHDFLLGQRVIVGSAFRYTHQLPNSEQRALLRNGESGLAHLDNTFTLRRKLGDLIDAEVSSTVYSPSKQFSLVGILSMSRKFSDSYQGGNEDFSVQGLGNNTDYLTQRMEFGLGYSTIPLFVAKKFALPLEAKISHNFMLGGRNTALSDFTRFDFIVYF